MTTSGRIYNVRMEGGAAKLIIMVNCGTNEEPIWEKRNMMALSPQELWDGLNAMDAIAAGADRHQQLQKLTRAEEHNRLDELALAWEAQGNQIKRLPMVTGRKLRMNAEEEQEILNLLADLDDEAEEEVDAIVREVA